MKTSISNSFVRGVCFGLGLAVMGGASSMGAGHSTIREQITPAQSNALNRQQQIGIAFIDFIRKDNNFMDQLRAEFTGQVNDFAGFHSRLEAVELLIAPKFENWFSQTYRGDAAAQAQKEKALISVDASLVTVMAEDTTKGADQVLAEARELL